jgi:DnaK suppressor protein
MKNRATTVTTPPRQTSRHDELKRALEDRRRSIDSSIRDRLSTVRSEWAGANTVGVLDEWEVADVDLQEDIELALIQIAQETIRRIDDALARLEAGHYGRCVECGDEISEARLRALPFAVRCVGCEQAREPATGRRQMLERRLPLFTDIAIGFK